MKKRILFLQLIIIGLPLVLGAQVIQIEGSWESMGVPAGPVKAISENFFEEGGLIISGRHSPLHESHISTGNLDFQGWELREENIIGDTYRINRFHDSYFISGSIDSVGQVLTFNPETGDVTNEFGVFDVSVRDIYIEERYPETVFFGGVYDQVGDQSIQYLAAHSEYAGGFYDIWSNPFKVYDFEEWNEYMYFGAQGTVSPLFRYDHSDGSIEQIMFETYVFEISQLEKIEDKLAFTSNTPVPGFGHPLYTIDTQNIIDTLLYTRNGPILDIETYTDLNGNQMILFAGYFDQVYWQGEIHEMNSVGAISSGLSENIYSFSNGIDGDIDDVEIVDSQILVGGNFVQDGNGNPVTFIAKWANITDISEQTIRKPRVYPNPTSKQVTVEIDIEPGVLMKLYDLSGRTILTQSALGSGQERIDLESLPFGFYVLQINQFQIKLSKN